MAQGKDTTNLAGLLFRFMGMEDPMLGMLEWLCGQMMEAEVSSQLGAGTSSHPVPFARICVSARSQYAPWSSGRGLVPS